MQETFKITKTSRAIISQFLDKYTLEQLNTIPDGFTNNLIWNIAHVVVVQQVLVYKLSGLPMVISDEMIEKYKKGSVVEHVVSQSEVDEIKALLISTLDKTEADYANGVFENYQEYPTSTGFVISSAEAAMAFNNFHEGLHIGIMMSIRKFI